MDELKTTAHTPSLVWKGLEGVAYVAPESTAVLTSISTEGGALAAIPAGWKPIGLVTKDGGYTFGSETETSDVTAHGYAQLIRRDITSVMKSCTVTVIEALNRHVQEWAYGIDLSAVTPDPATKEITFDHPDRPAVRYGRLLVINKDGAGADAVYRAKLMTRVSVTNFPEEVWSEESPAQFELTFDCYVDDEAGTSQREFIAGPGLTAERLAKMGFGA